MARTKRAQPLRHTPQLYRGEESERTTVSTKAYDHFITDLNVFDAAQRIRDTINPVFYEAFNKQLQRLDERLRYNINITWEGADLDDYRVDLPSNSQRVLPAWITEYGQCSTFDTIDSLYQRMMDLKNCERRTLSPLDISYDTIIMRGPDDNTVVFKVLSENPAYTEALNTQNWCSDFSYWNNTDKDENVSEEEWERRAQYWREIPYAPVGGISIGFPQPTRTSVSLHHSRP